MPDASDLATQLIHAGEYGNQSVKHKQITPAAVPANGEAYRFFRLPANTLVNDLRYVNAALGGTGVTLSFGYRHVDGSSNQDAAFIAATAAVAAGNGRMTVAPVLLTKESYIVAVVGGGAPANAAAVDVVVNYEYKGAK